MSLVAAMSDPAMYGVDGPVEVRETHISWVFLVGDRAYKMKKPITLSFVDYGSPDRRRAMCEAELRLNRRLAPTIYLAVRSIVATADGFALAGAGSPGAVEHVVEMRRFDESNTLAARLTAGEVPPAQIDEVARVIADFHRAAEPAPLSDPVERIAAALDDSLKALDGRQGVRALRRFTDSYMRARASVLRERGERAVDGHADLRAEHVVLEQPIQIVDCVEFDRGLRVRDPGSDLAFLSMDVEALGHPAFARRLVKSYRAAGGDPGPPDLVAFYAVERALVRAKVDSLSPRRATRAGAKLALARRVSWRARGPQPIVVCGLSGSGKSHLAAALKATLGARVISSDVVRKELAGLAPSAHAPLEIYTRDFNERVYRELGRRGRAALGEADTGPVVIDATARDPSDRRALLSELGGAALFARCTAPSGVLRDRVRSRTRAGGSVSDADEAVLAAQRFVPISEVSPDRLHDLDTDRPVDEVVDSLEEWLDARLASVSA